MVRARIPVLLDALADRPFVAPSDIGVDQTVRAAIREIVAETEPPPIIGVIVELHVGRQCLTCGGPGLAASSSSKTQTSGHKSLPEPRIRRASAVCSGGTL